MPTETELGRKRQPLAKLLFEPGEIVAGLNRFQYIQADLDQRRPDAQHPAEDAADPVLFIVGRDDDADQFRVAHRVLPIVRKSSI